MAITFDLIYTNTIKETAIFSTKTSNYFITAITRKGTLHYFLHKLQKVKWISLI